jgi:hypothetical protein
MPVTKVRSEDHGVGADQRAIDVGVAVAGAGAAGADAAENRAGVAAHDAVAALRRAEFARAFELGSGEGVVGHGLLHRDAAGEPESGVFAARGLVRRRLPVSVRRCQTLRSAHRGGSADAGDDVRIEVRQAAWLGRSRSSGDQL